MVPFLRRATKCLLDSLLHTDKMVAVGAVVLNILARLHATRNERERETYNQEYYHNYPDQKTVLRTRFRSYVALKEKYQTPIDLNSGYKVIFRR